MNDAKILLVDDHVMFQEALGKTVKSVPLVKTVKGASSAKEALELIKNESWDLVLLDIEMPGMDGLTFLLELNHLNIRTKVLMLTTHRRDDMVQRAYQSGAKGYMLKDGSTSELKLAIETILKGGVYFTPEIQNSIFSTVVADNLFKKSLPKLTDREVQVLRLICEQKTGKEISDILDIAIPTVGAHRSNLLRKTKCVNMVGLVKFAIDNGYHRESRP